MPLLNLPDVLLLRITKNLPARHLIALIRTNRRLKLLLSPQLAALAILPENAILALCWAAVNRVEPTIINILENGPAIAVMRVISSEIAPRWEEVYRIPMESSPDAIKFIYTHAPNLYIKDLEDPDAADPDSNPALYWALRLRDVALIRLLLKNGAEHTNGGNGWERAMIMAAKDQDLERVQTSQAKQKHQRTQSLESAVLGGHEDIARQFLESEEDVNYSWTQEGSIHSLLNYLVKGHCQVRWPVPWTERSERMLRLLLAYGADPTIPDTDEKSALSSAGDHNHQGILQALSDPYPWNGVGPRPRGELKVVAIEKEGRFLEKWAIWKLARQTHRAAKRCYKRVGKSLTALFRRKTR